MHENKCSSDEKEGRFWFDALTYSRRANGKLINEFTPLEYDREDGNMTATTTNMAYNYEIKHYNGHDGYIRTSTYLYDPFKREYRYYSDYMIDYSKCKYLKDKALEEGRTPLLFVFFHDYLYVWDLNNVDIERKKEERWVNKRGYKYGEKEKCLMTHIPFVYDDGKEVWRKSMEEVWKRIEGYQNIVNGQNES